MSSVTDTPAAQRREIHYPDSDGQPMADNTLQFHWIVLIKENLEAMFQVRDGRIYQLGGDVTRRPIWAILDGT
jgi:hypothetical protein